MPRNWILLKFGEEFAVVKKAGDDLRAHFGARERIVRLGFFGYADVPTGRLEIERRVLSNRELQPHRVACINVVQVVHQWRKH